MTSEHSLEVYSMLAPGMFYYCRLVTVLVPGRLVSTYLLRIG
jgi:hypothetical protein